MVILNLWISLVFWFSASWFLFAVVSMMKWPWSAFDLNLVWNLLFSFLDISHRVKLKLLLRTGILFWHKLLIHEIILVVSFSRFSDHVNGLLQLYPDLSTFRWIAWKSWGEISLTWPDHSLNTTILCFQLITLHTLELTAYCQFSGCLFLVLSSFGSHMTYPEWDEWWVVLLHEFGRTINTALQPLVSMTDVRWCDLHWFEFMHHWMNDLDLSSSLE